MAPVSVCSPENLGILDFFFNKCLTTCTLYFENLSKLSAEGRKKFKISRQAVLNYDRAPSFSLTLFLVIFTIILPTHFLCDGTYIKVRGKTNYIFPVCRQKGVWNDFIPNPFLLDLKLFKRMTDFYKSIMLVILAPCLRSSTLPPAGQG